MTKQEGRKRAPLCSRVVNVTLISRNGAWLHRPFILQELARLFWISIESPSLPQLTQFLQLSLCCCYAFPPKFIQLLLNLMPSITFTHTFVKLIVPMHVYSSTLNDCIYNSYTLWFELHFQIATYGCRIRQTYSRDISSHYLQALEIVIHDSL